MNIKILDITRNDVQVFLNGPFIKIFNVLPESAWYIWNGSTFSYVSGVSRIEVPLTSTPPLSWLLKVYTEHGAVDGDVTLIHLHDSPWGHSGCFFPAAD